MTTISVADTFAGTVGDQVGSRPPTTSDHGSTWDPVGGSAWWLLASGPKAVTSGTSNGAYVAFSGIDSSGTVTNATIKITLNTAGATAFGGNFGGVGLYLAGTIQPVTCNIISESGTYKAFGTLGDGGDYETSLTSGSSWEIEVSAIGAELTCKVNGTTVGSYSSNTHNIAISGSNTVGTVTMSANNLSMTDFSLVFDYEGDEPEPPSQFWTSLIGSHEVV